MVIQRGYQEVGFGVDEPRWMRVDDEWSNTMSRLIHIFGCVLASVAVLMLPGCSSSTTVDGQPSVRPPAGAGSGHQTQRFPPGVVSDGRRLQSVEIRSTDLPRRLLVLPAPGGRTVHNEVTLDNCGYRFTSESNRIARRQLEIIDHSEPAARFGNEIVSYRTTSQARQALSQWHRSVETCPSGYTPSAVAAEPPLRYDIIGDTTNTASLPVSRNEITSESARPKTGTRLWLTAIFQTHGRYLDAVYLDAKHPPTTTEEKTAVALARATGHRLGQLPN